MYDLLGEFAHRYILAVVRSFERGVNVDASKIRLQTKLNLPLLVFIEIVCVCGVCVIWTID